MDKGTCLIAGCQRPVRTRGLCNAHYIQLNRKGRVEEVAAPRKVMPDKAVCSVLGCERDARGREWCMAHYKRWQKYGDPEHLSRNVRPLKPRPPCSINGCDREAAARGWCTIHYARWANHGDPDPDLPQFRNGPCTTEGCERTARRDGLCGECYRSSKEHARDYYLRGRFGITIEDYDKMLAEQNGGCGICADPEPPAPKGRNTRFTVDHDHDIAPSMKATPESIRRILCHQCNFGLGAFDDDPDRLAAALSYLLGWKGLPARTVIPSRVPSLGLTLRPMTVGATGDAL